MTKTILPCVIETILIAKDFVRTKQTHRMLTKFINSN